jgi:hypothetical protein
VSNRRDRKPNALKHGGFSKVEVLPWEDAKEYKALLQDLIDEHQPEGPLEIDCVSTIASLLWRKKRVRAKRNLDTAAALDRVDNRVLWEDPPPLFDTKQERTTHALATIWSSGASASPPRDDYQQLLAFSTSLFREDKERFVQSSIRMLPAEFATHLNEKVPLAAFEDAEEWIVALKKEVDGVLLPMVRGRAPQASAYYETASAFLTGDRLLEDLDVEERLDAGIERALKRLWQLQVARDLRSAREPKLIDSKPLKQLKKPDDEVPKEKE